MFNGHSMLTSLASQRNDHFCPKVADSCKIEWALSPKYRKSFWAENSNIAIRGLGLASAMKPYLRLRQGRPPPHNPALFTANCQLCANSQRVPTCWDCALIHFVPEPSSQCHPSNGHSMLTRDASSLKGAGGLRPHFASVKDFFSVLGHKSIHGVKVKILCYAYLVTCRHHLVLPKARCSPGVLDVTCFCSVSVLKVCVRHDSGDRHKLLKQVFFRCFKGVIKECLRGSSGVLSHNS